VQLWPWLRVPLWGIESIPPIALAGLRVTMAPRPLVVFNEAAGHPVEVPLDRPVLPAADRGGEVAGRVFRPPLTRDDESTSLMFLRRAAGTPAR
jgi:hypothetical protein